MGLGSYCPDCGANLECMMCGGKGRVENLDLPVGGSTYCCGRAQFSDYCSSCGRSLGSRLPLMEKTKACTHCGGMGTVRHHACRKRGW